MTVVQDTAPEQATALPVVEVVLPKVNLLPPEIAEGRRFRRIQAGLGGGLLVAVGAVALLHASAAHSTEQAAAELAAATGRGAALRAESAEYADVQRIHAEAAAAQTMLAQAMAQEVRFSTLLDDLSRSVPDDVWLDNVTFTQAGPAAAVPVGGTPAAASSGVGTVTFSGSGREHDDVAAWLDSLAEQERFADATFTRSVAVAQDGRSTVSFTSSATLSSAALSGRYTDVDGG